MCESAEQDGLGQAGGCVFSPDPVLSPASTTPFSELQAFRLGFFLSLLLNFHRNPADEEYSPFFIDEGTDTQRGVEICLWLLDQGMTGVREHHVCLAPVPQSSVFSPENSGNFLSALLLPTIPPLKGPDLMELLP